MKISIVIPVYNEEKTLIDIIGKVRNAPLGPGIADRELIIIDDCSVDGTRAILKTIADPMIKVVYHEKNCGKGAALRTGFAHCSGDVIIIQDADLEYNPNEYPTLLAPIVEGDADVVYGSRFIGGGRHRVLYFWHSMGNLFLTALSNAFTDLNLTDMETCYKVMKRDVVQRLTIRENRFGFEPELTARLAALARNEDIRIYEVGISYRGRTYNEGKKIGMRDGFRALYCILRYNTSRLADSVKSSVEGLFGTAVMLGVFLILAQFDAFQSIKGWSIVNAISIEISFLASCFIYWCIPSRIAESREGRSLGGILRFHLRNVLPFAVRVAAFPLMMQFLDFGWVAAGCVSAALGLLFSFFGINYRKTTTKTGNRR